MRIYLPSTLPMVAALLHTGEIGPVPVRGYAVTPALREWYSSGDLEELEYTAMTHAARASLRLLSHDPTAPRRRVVLAAELHEEYVTSDASGFDEPAVVEIKIPVLLRHIVSAHLDDVAVASEIASAADALQAADAGDDDARFTVDSAEGQELLWYASQELTDLTG
jgi:hypothetical protein